MNTLLRYGAALCAVSLVSGCATVTRGTKQKFEIVSTPTGANVTTTTGITCVTPCKLKIKRKPGFAATVSKAGFKSAKVMVTSDMHGGGTAGIAGNFVAGGLIGVAVDASNGSLNDLRPNPLMIELEADTAPAGGAVVAGGPVVAVAPTEAAPGDTPKP